MKISILTPDLSHNCLGRAYLLAKMIQKHYGVEILGPIFGNGIWTPVANDRSIVYESVKIRGRIRPYWRLRDLIKNADGDVIYTCKPLFVSFGTGLLIKIFKKKPLILDIDDWQMGFAKASNPSLVEHFKSLVYSTLHFYEIGSYWDSLIGEKLTYFADEITVSNRFLKKRFGGTVVWHARDTEAFNPAKFDKNLIRGKYKIKNDEKIVMFFGSPVAYKGVEDAVKAVDLVESRDVVLVIAGVGQDRYSRSLVRFGRQMLGDRFRWFGLQPFDRVPEFLAMADIAVIPQRKNFATIGQIPAKVFDAMAMAKPIIGTRVSDLPEILDGCGWLVEPENPEQLAQAIQYVFGHPKEAREKGQKARQKCIEKYSWDAMERILIKIFEKYE